MDWWKENKWSVISTKLSHLETSSLETHTSETKATGSKQNSNRKKRKTESGKGSKKWLIKIGDIKKWKNTKNEAKLWKDLKASLLQFYESSWNSQEASHFIKTMTQWQPSWKEKWSRNSKMEHQLSSSWIHKNTMESLLHKKSKVGSPASKRKMGIIRWITSDPDIGKPKQYQR